MPFGFILQLFCPIMFFSPPHSSNKTIGSNSVVMRWQLLVLWQMQFTSCFIAYKDFTRNNSCLWNIFVCLRSHVQLIEVFFYTCLYYIWNSIYMGPFSAKSDPLKIQGALMLEVISIYDSGSWSFNCSARQNGRTAAYKRERSVTWNISFVNLFSFFRYMESLWDNFCILEKLSGSS